MKINLTDPMQVKYTESFLKTPCELLTHFDSAMVVDTIWFDTLREEQDKLYQIISSPNW